MQANVFSIEKTHQHILFWRKIHSFVSITDRNSTPLCPYLCLQSNQLHATWWLFVFGFQCEQDDCPKTGSLHVHVFGLRPVCSINFSRDHSSDKLIDFLDSQLETHYSILKTNEDRGSSLEAQGSRLKGLSTYFWAVLYISKRCHLENWGLFAYVISQKQRANQGKKIHSDVFLFNWRWHAKF